MNIVARSRPRLRLTFKVLILCILDGMSLFLNARRIRRKILQHLQVQQHRDSHVALELRNSYVAIYREICMQLATLLDSYSPENTIQPEAAALFAHIDSEQGLESWLNLKRELVDCLQRVADCRKRSKAADESYGQKAPWGQVSRLLSSDADKKVIAALLNDKKKAKLELDQATAGVTAIEMHIQGQAEQILRSTAEDSDKLKILRDTPSPIQEAIALLLTRCNDEMNAIWSKHALVQQDTLTEIAGLIAELRQEFQSGIFTSTEATVAGETLHE